MTKIVRLYWFEQHTGLSMNEVHAAGIGVAAPALVSRCGVKQAGRPEEATGRLLRNTAYRDGAITDSPPGRP